MTARPPAAAGRPVRVAVVGLGWAGREIWLPRLAAHPGFEVVAVVDPQPVVRDQARDTHAVASAYADVEALPAGTVDLAVVAVPNHLHAVVAVRLLRRGVPVFLEKPVCLTSAEAGILADAERDGGAVLLAGSAARYRADIRALADVAGGLGPIRHVDVAWVRARGVPDAGGWFTRRDQSGGGALVDLGWHLLDTVLPLLGPARVTHAIGSVSDDFVNDSAAHAAWRGGADTAGHVPGDVEDTARGFLLTDTGASVALHACWASHESLDRTTVTVHGAAGSATLRCTFGFSPNREPTPVLTRTRDGRTARLPLPGEPIGAEYDHQLDALPGLLADPAARGAAVAEARRTIDIIERIYQCARPTRPERQHALVGHRAG
ncbi:Gfo/Idh/MocA family protein [Micromonospora aurantiaca]|uniref:Gfo/Idh/MocA family oxidoreductase n=1 Tax=Micromonospora aurantiaca (nom. illeg.) TaxID=47850 RepID=A0ABQ6UDS3_9ACTN|nr:Gfo/Idh/MocA family oxidoreductase [Micromonospora aurantiaca]KAB1109411.1 Gfo/Idh/MocA family oxidoreductase [Micromonospora aurantiaca]UFN96884.1 Gfo/Idh/MocA family oxidoreductase [Micromonospora aurantiaca]